jgi:hypothetical protein
VAQRGTEERRVVPGFAGRRCALGALVAVAAMASCCGGTAGREAAPNDAPADGGASVDAVAEGSSEDAGDPAVAEEPSDECSGDGIVPDSTGFVAADMNASGITGSWSVYTDCEDYGPLEAGVPEPGKDCTVVSSPAPGSPLAPQPGTAQICSTGTTAQVLSEDQWPLRWGAYMGLGLADPAGAAQDFDARAAGVRGFCFYVSGNSVPAFRVRFPTDTGIADRNWYQATLQHEGWHQVLFADLGQVAPTDVAFDASKLLSIEFEIPASRLETVSWDFCIDGLVALR